MNNIVLIGFMGCGKTTFGKWIASNYNMEFIDTDEYIESKENRKISDIFASDGEEFFRKLETSTIEELSKNTSNAVISVGGGLPVRECNRAILKQLGKVVYLETSIDELERRLKNDTKRPLLAGGNIREKIESLMSAREDIYISVADCVIKTDNKSFKQIYEEVRQ